MRIRRQKFSQVALWGAAAAAVTTTWNPSDKGAVTLSGGNLIATLSGGDGNVRAIASHTTGKFFHSITIGPNYALNSIGIANAAESITSGFLGSSANSVGVFGTNSVFLNGSNIGGIGTFTTGDVVDLAIDLGGKLLWGRKNGGNWNGSPTNDPATGVGGLDISALNAGPYFPAGGLDDTSGSMTANFGGSAYSFAAPSGYINW